MNIQENIEEAPKGAQFYIDKVSEIKECAKALINNDSPKSLEAQRALFWANAVLAGLKEMPDVPSSELEDRYLEFFERWYSEPSHLSREILEAYVDAIKEELEAREEN